MLQKDDQLIITLMDIIKIPAYRHRHRHRRD